MVGVMSMSRAACKAWIKIEAPALQQTKSLLFIFGSSLNFERWRLRGIEQHQGTQSIRRCSQSRIFVSRILSSKEALVVSSFKFKLPTFFGKDSKDFCKLPVMPMWDSKDGFTGVR
jgi:hypothetical protein